ncbi:MAG: acyl-CoA dehydratase activase [Planctomycetes bacterium]|nr:acyl-CoA dehydratase activase [Planctomycetota bacterium]
MIVAGVDVGSTATKAILLDGNRRILGRGLAPTGANVVRAAERVFREALRGTGFEEWDVAYTVGTGYGRFKVPFGDAQVTEIGCHARGACFLFPGTRTILDMGGQDTKAIRVGPEGEVLEFCMNDKCAAGTGRFLEAAAGVLGLPLADLGEVAARSRSPLRITNVCTVFVESEIVSHLARGSAPEDILAGVHLAIAGRSIALLRRVGIVPEVTFTGGVSRNAAMVRALGEKLGLRLNVGEDSPFIGAAGAALFALDRAAAGLPRREKSAPAGTEKS